MANEYKKLDHGSIIGRGDMMLKAEKGRLDTRSLYVYQVVIDAAARPEEKGTPVLLSRVEALGLIRKHLDKMYINREGICFGVSRSGALFDGGRPVNEWDLARRIIDLNVPESEVLNAIRVLQATNAKVAPKGWFIFDGSKTILSDLAEQSEHRSVREAAKGALSSLTEHATKTLVDFASKMTLSDVYAAKFPFDSEAIRSAVYWADRKDPRARAILAEIAGIEKVGRLMPEVAYAAKMALAESQ